MTIPYWRSDRDYFGVKDARRDRHLEQIETQERIDRRIKLSSSDGSYSVAVTKKDCGK